MGKTSDFLDSERGAILDLFAARAGGEHDELRLHAERMLGAIAGALGGARGSRPSLPGDGSADRADPVLAVRTQRLLRTCIDDRLDATGATLTAGERNALTGALFHVLEDTVTRGATDSASTAEMQARLRASEERYRTLFESIDDGYCLMQMIVDETGKTVDYRFLETNAAFEGQTGLKGAVGKTALELVPTLDESWFRLYGGVASTGQSARFENHAPAMGRWFDVYASRVGRSDLLQVALVFKDITDRKRAEEERERLLLLESAARKTAEEASRLKDDFLATVSHELRTPLNSILGWSQMLREGQLSEEKRARAIATIERNVRAQVELIDDLLDVSRIAEGKLRLDVDLVDLETVVGAALETIRPAADAKDLRVKTSFAGQTAVLGDGSRLQQVIWNLLTNAVKFTPRGGEVAARAFASPTQVEVTVSDSGRGIAPDFLPHVFDRFRQADGGTTRAHGGLGLGLSIVRQIVEMHGGVVTVSSAGVDLGATFRIQLPRPDLSNVRGGVLKGASPYVASPLHAERLAKTSIVVVDDQEDTRDVLRALLEGCGARVRGAPSVAHALELLEAEPPELLISDIAMPGEDGYSLIEKIRAMPGAVRVVPAVALTAFARKEDRVRALERGFDNHVSKPIEPSELLAVIASLLARRR
ncbi:MAG: response regulator [Labilithrix sp.]|nr:response regulator [Labilithrix sp.]